MNQGEIYNRGLKIATSTKSERNVVMSIVPKGALNLTLTHPHPSSSIPREMDAAKQNRLSLREEAYIVESVAMPKVEAQQKPGDVAHKVQPSPPATALSGARPRLVRAAEVPSAPAPAPWAEAPRTPPATRVRVAGKTTQPFFRFPSGKTAGWIAAAFGTAALVVLLPALLVSRGPHAPAVRSTPEPVPAKITAPTPLAKPRPSVTAPVQASNVPVRVYLSHTGAVETLPLEEYVSGVLAAEMPASFDLEALKAQAIAARTFIVRRLSDGDKSGVPGKAANVTDTVMHQAYLSRQKLDGWNTSGEGEKLAKIRRAVKETRGLIVTYQGKPITASFFSASSGYTENSEEYWNQRIPYLRSVSSPWDAKLDPSYKKKVTLSLPTFFNKLGISQPSMPVSGTTKGTSKSWYTILSNTTGHRVNQVRIGESTFTGRQVRERLGLRSSQFNFKIIEGNKIEITTYGYGHGVGMSQWGAEGMARAGFTASEILKHYYSGIELQGDAKLLDRK
nr:stage II sporulation protein D [Paenibacillus shirakamiensis]